MEECPAEAREGTLGGGRGSEDQVPLWSGTGVQRGWGEDRGGGRASNLVLVENLLYS